MSAVAALRTRITGRLLHLVTMASGVLIALYGVVSFGAGLTS